MIQYDFEIEKAPVVDRTGREWVVSAIMKVTSRINATCLPPMSKEELKRLADVINDFLNAR